MTTAIASLRARLPARWRYPADGEGVEISPRDTRLDDGPARRDLGVHPRPFEETIHDTISWMGDAGRLPSRYRPSG